MPYRNLSLDDFAKHMGMDARVVRRMADRGELPGHKVGGEWRFNRAQITEWLQVKMHTFDEQRLISLEQTMGGEAGDLIVTCLIGCEGIDVSLPARTRASVLRELVKLADRTGLLYDAKGLLEALEQRETLCSTALMYGVAIPHPRQPMPYASAEPLICAARLSKGIGFGSPYHDLSRLFFLICCHDDRHHLRVLARLMRILDQETIEHLMEVETPEALLDALINKERQVIASTKG